MPKGKLRLGAIGHSIRILLMFLFVLNMSSGLFGPLFAVFVAHSILGASLRTVGFAVAVYAITKALLQIPFARGIDAKKGEKDDFIMLLIGVGLSITYPIILLFIRTPSHLYLAEILSGAGDAALMAAYYAIFAHHADRGREGLEWSFFSVWGLTISSAVGGALGGIMADKFGFSITLMSAAALNALAAGLLFSLRPYLKHGRAQR